MVEKNNMCTFLERKLTLRLRHMAVAFLINEKNEIVFLKKKEDHHMLPGYFVPVGGHMEKDEMNEPLKACLREINEEAGLTNDDITEIRIKYILHRILDDEIRIQYVFVTKVKNGAVLVESDEGKLYWKSLEEIMFSKITKPVKEAVRHYFEEGHKTDEIYVLSFNED